MPHTQWDSWADETDLKRGVDDVEDEVDVVGDIDWKLIDDDGSIESIAFMGEPGDACNQEKGAAN